MMVTLIREARLMKCFADREERAVTRYCRLLNDVATSRYVREYVDYKSLRPSVCPYARDRL